jgi:hypothetical protein
MHLAAEDNLHFGYTRNDKNLDYLYCHPAIMLQISGNCRLDATALAVYIIEGK